MTVMNKNVFEKIRQETINDVQQMCERCFDFNMYQQGNDYFVRYTRVSVCKERGCPKQQYRWICFNSTGERTNCDPIFNSIKESNQFYANMTLLKEFELSDLPLNFFD